MQALHCALLHVEDVVDGNSVDPGLQPATEIELRQPRDHANKDFLCRVFRILAVPQHAQGKAINVALEISHETIEGVAIPIDGPPGDVFERHRLCHHRSISDFSVASSDCSVAR
jgi:hypothetical protein